MKEKKFSVVGSGFDWPIFFWVQFCSIVYNLLMKFNRIRLISITEGSIVGKPKPFSKTKSFFIFLHHPHNHENKLPDQCHPRDVVPRDLAFLLTFYNQYCCSGLHVLLNYISTRRSLYFLDHTHKNHASSSTFSSSYPRMHLRSVWTKAGRVG